MSKKNKEIIDDDPLSWLKAGNDLDEDEPVSNKVEAKHETGNEEQGCEEKNQPEVDSPEVYKEQIMVKEDSEDTENNENILMAEDEKNTDKECDGEELKVSDESVNDETQLSENNEEGVAMATSNNENIVLEEDVSIVQVAGLKEAWLPLLDSGKDININASAVEDIDTAGLQLLLSLVKTANNAGKAVTWEEPSEAVINAIKETSLKDALGIQI